MTYAIGIDLGGTNIKAVAVAEDGEILEQSTCETGDVGVDGWVERVREQVRQLEVRRGTPPTWIGLASPGMAARDRRSMVSVSGQLSPIAGVDWTERLGLDREISLLNDAQAALVAEAWRGAAAGRRHAILLTLGTGVGGAVLSEGRLMRGAIGRAGDMGHVTIWKDGPPDSSNMPGSLEDAIGNKSVPARSNGRFASTREMVEAYLAGDEQAGAVWLESVYGLACAIASFVNVLDPEVVVIGGGIAAAGPALFEPLATYLDRVEWRPLGVGVPVVPALLGDYAGALGAARNVMAGVSAESVRSSK